MYVVFSESLAERVQQETKVPYTLMYKGWAAAEGVDLSKPFRVVTEQPYQDPRFTEVYHPRTQTKVLVDSRLFVPAVINKSLEDYL